MATRLGLTSASAPFSFARPRPFSTRRITHFCRKHPCRQPMPLVILPMFELLQATVNPFVPFSPEFHSPVKSGRDFLVAATWPKNLDDGQPSVCSNLISDRER